MRVVIQRVSSASVQIQGVTRAEIGAGMLLFLGIEAFDQEEDIDWLVKKIVHLRIFDDLEGVMNRSILDVEGEVLLISQFTLYASTKKGHRPSYIRAAKPPFATEQYERFREVLQRNLPTQVKTGVFGADMQVCLVNDGPVTITIDTKIKE